MRAAYIHKAEYLDEHRLVLQWWAGYLDANRQKMVNQLDFVKMDRKLIFRKNVLGMRLLKLIFFLILFTNSPFKNDRFWD